MKIDAYNLEHIRLNQAIRRAPAGDIELVRCMGQRFIGAGVSDKNINISGVPGNALGAYLDGAEIAVLGSAQDAMGDTMNFGEIAVHGSAGDAVGYAMRGGKVLIKGDVGYRVGIHMKAFEKSVPVLVCGGKARDFFGEYMAGGVLVLLGMNGRDEAQPIAGSFLGAGMHGGVIYVRGTVEPWQCGAEVGITEATEADLAQLKPIIDEYASALGMDAE